MSKNVYSAFESNSVNDEVARVPNTPNTPSSPNLFDCGNGNEVSFDEINLTEFYSDNNENDERLVELRRKIDVNKWFYLRNDKFDIIALRKKTVYEKYKDDNKFIGYKFVDFFKDENDVCILLIQLVNEMEKMKTIGKVLFFRELYLSTRKNKQVQELYKKYIGGGESVFFMNEKENVKYYRWTFIVHKNRYVYIKKLIGDKINNLGLDINFKDIKNYNDVFDYCKNNYDEL